MIWSSNSTRHSRPSFCEMSGKVRSDDTADADLDDWEVLLETLDFFGMSFTGRSNREFLGGRVD